MDTCRARCWLAVGAALTVLTSNPHGARGAAPGRAPGDGEAPSPIYVLLEASIEDEINEGSFERIPWILDTMAALASSARAYRPVCLLQFNGVTANRLGQEDYATGFVRRVRDAVAAGTIEVGYDGTEEPTFAARPRPNLRGAGTPDARWLARLQAHEWFLREWKDPLSGEPDPSKPGGFVRVRDVFGAVTFAKGLTYEPWYSAELVHALAHLDARPALAGFMENTAYPARNFDGYRAGAPGVSNELAPDATSAPEVFWLDTVVHISDYGALGARVFDAVEGPNALEKLLAGFNRERPHIVRVRLGSPAVYCKPGFGAKRYRTPLEYAYDNPKLPKLPEDGAKSPEERAAAYASERATLDWLVRHFFVEHPGSRFISVGELVTQAETGLADVVPAAQLADAAHGIVAAVDASNGHLPAFVQAGGRWFSLAETYGLLAAALARQAETGQRPRAVTPRALLGPLAVLEGTGAPGRRVSIAALAARCARFEASLQEGWASVPHHVVPSTLDVDGVELTAGEALRAMAEAYLAGSDAREIAVTWTSGFSPLALRLPETRARADSGSTWTLKPARIRTVPVATR